MKQKKCKAKGCGIAFSPRTALQVVCSPSCAHAFTKEKREQAERKARSDERKKDREKREQLKTIPQLIEEAQRDFNRYIRLRDRGRGCISCGRPLQLGGVGGGFDAGHYRSRGAAGHLRFDEDNCHGQCKFCNSYGGGRHADYRLGLIDRIGPERVAALEARNEPVKWTRELLAEIRQTYKAKAKELEREDTTQAR